MKLARDWLPPVALRRLGRMIREGNSFKGEYNSWQEAEAQCLGYDTDEIISKVLTASLKVKNGEAAYERDSVNFDHIEYSWPVMSGIMCAAANNSGRLNVLDFGGSLGSSYYQNRSLLLALPYVRWNIVEQAHYCKAGKTHIQDQTLRFYETIDDCLVENKPNVILLSSVLQYLSKPREILSLLLNVDADVIVIDRTIVNYSLTDRIYVQDVPSSIYSASYPCWSLSESSLLEMALKNYQLIDSFYCPGFSLLKYINSEFKGYFFKRVE